MLAEVARGDHLLVAIGQYSPVPLEVVRAFVIDVARRPQVLADTWIAPSELEVVAATLGARRGETDAMYGTAWKLVWTAGNVWDRRGRRAWVDAGQLHLESDVVDAADVRAVEGFVSEGAVTRGVRIALRSGTRLAVAKQRELMAMIDPTYDGLDAMCDAAWVESLGRALAGALEVPYEAVTSPR